jgi:hypothetical protein
MTRYEVGRTAWRGYIAGLSATLLVALVGQGFLYRLPAGQGPLGVVQDFGYTFTGICLLGGFLLARRARRRQARVKDLRPEILGRFIWREYLAIAFACSVSTGFGLLYWGLGGRQVERHARTFIALSPIAFLALAPRPGRWPADPA